MVEDVARIAAGRQAGLRPGEIARAVGVDRKTVAKYARAAAAEGAGAVAGRSPSEEWEEWVRRRFPELADGRLRRATWPSLSAHDATIARLLGQGASIPAVHRELRRRGDCPVSLSTLRRYVSERSGEAATETRHRPGGLPGR